MRVWELAEELRVVTSRVLELIATHDKYVTSHLANVPRQALDAIRAAPPEPMWAPGHYYDWHKPPAALTVTPSSGPGAGSGGSQPGTGGQPGRRHPARRYRRRPGPRPVSYEPPYEEDAHGYGNDPTDELRYEPIWSTRDVAWYFSVKPATVRQWVKRGHLEPCGKDGPSHIFERAAIFAATDAIAARNKLAGRADPEARSVTADAFVAGDSIRPFPSSERPRGRGPVAADIALAGLGSRGLHRLATVSPDTLLTTAQAAATLGLAPSTIRSWVRRGHLEPSPSRSARQLNFRLADVYRAARRR